MTKNKLEAAETITGPGLAALVSLYDSAYACDQNAELAGEIVRELCKSIEAAADKFGGHIGNFTGDGFLVLFTSIESGILCLSELIRAWEGLRGKYVEKYLAAGVPMSDSHFLALSTGISFGNLAPVAIKSTVHYSGSGIIKAQRCEVSSKDYFRLDRLGELKAPNFVFIDGSAERLIRARNDFYISEQLSARSEVYSEPLDASGRYELETREQFIYAVWPKEAAVPAARSAAELGKLGLAQSKSDIADRLVLAANAVKTGNTQHDQAAAATGKRRLELLGAAVTAYREALQLYAPESSPREYAYAQYSLGKALKSQATTLTGENKLEKLIESAAAQREALKIFTIGSDPGDYAQAQNSLGNALRDQASYMTGEGKKKKIDEAIAAHLEALRVFTLESDPDNYAMVQNNLGNASDSLADFFSGPEKLQRQDEAVKAYMETLRVYDFKSFPERYSGTHVNLGSSLLKQARIISGQARLDKFNDAINSCREALRGYPLDKFPHYHALALNNLGNALRDSSECFPVEKRAVMLDEAVNSYGSALDILKPDSSPDLYAITQANLGDALTAQAGMLAGVERAQKINKAVQAYNEALNIYNSASYHDRHVKVTKKLAELNSLTAQAEKEAAVGRITAQVAHDIRSPLVALDAALKYADSMPEAQRVMLRHAVNRIRDIASNLLEKNREPQEGRPAAPGEAAQLPSVCLLSSLVEPVIAEKRMQYGLSRAAVDFEMTQAAYGVFAAVQPAEFRRLLSNLINNSVEALKKEGRVAVTLGTEGEYAVVRVSDNGEGISPETLGKLGRRGFTLGKTGGSGLGLYHARTAVESWGGKLEIASEPGKGTAVSVLLPAASASEWFVPELELKAGRCVVVLDDDETIHGVWRGRLESSRTAEKGVELCSFSSPEKLRCWVKENSVKAAGAVYLLDYELLGSDETGLGLARALGLEGRAVLVTSRYEEKNLLEECRRIKMRIIPKGLAGLVPITVKAAVSEASALSLGGPVVLIDDDSLVRMNWKAAARAKGVDLKIFSSPAEFYAAAGIPKDARLYLDSDLGGGVKGEEFAQALKDKGYINIYLETGYPPEKFARLSWLKVVGKEPPW